MSNYDKSTILSILNNFAKICDKRSKEIYSIEHDENLSDSGKSYKKECLLSDYEKELSNNKSKIEEIIDSAINQIKKTRADNSVGKLADAGYQIGLQNVLTMIKNGAVPSTDDFKSIIEIYKKDCNAISLISATVSSSDIPLNDKMAFSSLLPVDNIERNIDLLTRVRNNILTYMNGFYRLGIESQIDSVSRLFNDDLTLSENPWG